MKTFWQDIWSEKKSHNAYAPWIEDIIRDNKRIRCQQWSNIEESEVAEALKKSHKWRSLGVDKVPNFWLDTLHATYKCMASNLNKIFENPKNIPTWICKRHTFLIPKCEETTDPKNYRPITCLPTTYKLLTSRMAERVHKHLEENKIFLLDQKGCRKGSYGCKDQLLVNRMIMKKMKSRARNLSTAWINYKKVFEVCLIHG